MQSNSAALPLPRFETEPRERYPYGARSEAAIYVGDLLTAEVPSLAAPDGPLEIVAIARRPGVLSKVAVRARPDALVTPLTHGVGADPVARASQRLHAEPTAAVRVRVGAEAVARASQWPDAEASRAVHLGIGADHLARVSERLDGERIQVVRWQRSASGYIADALGLGEEPPMLLLPGLRHARVLLGEIDVRGIAGWRGLNAILASALTGWRIRLEPIAGTPTWRRLRAAMLARRSVAATVLGVTSSSIRVDLGGVYGRLSASAGLLAVGHELEVRITRMDEDEGRIFVAAQPGGGAQPKLF